MELFSIHCTTCQAKLKVRSEEAIGQILACPKCGSMVHIIPPPGWSAGSASAAEPVAVPSEQTVAEASAATASTAAHATAAPEPQVPAKAAAVAAVAAAAAPAQEKALVQTATIPAPPPYQPLTPAGWTSPAEQLWHKVVMYSAVGGVTLFLLGAVSGYLWTRRGSPPVADAAPTASPATTSTPIASKEEAETPEPEAASEPKPVPAPAAPAEQEPPQPQKAEDAVADEPAVPPLPELDPQPADPLPEQPAERAEDETPAEPPAATNTAVLPGFGLFGDDDGEKAEPAAKSTKAEEAGLAALEENLVEHKDEPVPVATHEPASRRFPDPEQLPGRDLTALLAERLPQVEFTNVPLVDFLEMIGELTRLPISYDLDAMRAANVRLTGPISIRRENVVVAEILTEAAAQQGLTYQTDGQHVLLTAPAPARSYSYPYTDLVEEGKREEFVGLLQTLVAPKSWQATGGDGTIKVAGENLEIFQTPAVHFELIEFCEKLRVARGLPLRSRFPAERFQLTTRSERAARFLDNPVGCTYFRPTRLVDVVRFFEQASGMTILIDWRSLEREDYHPGSEIGCIVEQQPLVSALDVLLEPLGLSWRVIDPLTLEVYAASDAASKMEVEFYPLERLLDQGLSSDDVLASIHARTPEDSWQNAGGKGVAWYDSLSKAFVIRQSPAVHRQIAALLAGLAND